MPRGEKSAYTDKQKRQAEHIEEGYLEKGLSRKTAEARAWATVNKQDGGGKKSKATKKKTPARGKRGTATQSSAAQAEKRRSSKRSKKAERTKA